MKIFQEFFFDLLKNNSLFFLFGGGLVIAHLGYLGGTITFSRADDESQITKYSIFFGDQDGEELHNYFVN